MKLWKWLKLQKVIFRFENLIYSSLKPDDFDILESSLNKLHEILYSRRDQIESLPTHRYVKAKDLKDILNNLPEDAKIKVGHEGNEYSAVDVKYDQDINSILIV